MSALAGNRGRTASSSSPSLMKSLLLAAALAVAAIPAAFAQDPEPAGQEPASPAGTVAAAAAVIQRIFPGTLSGLTFPTSYDVEQCASRKLLKSGAFLLNDLKEGEGCALQDENAFEIYNTTGENVVPFNSSDWVVELKRPFKNDTVIRVVSPLRKPVYYCYALGHLGLSGIGSVPQPTEQPPAEVPADQADQAVDNAATVSEQDNTNVNLTFTPELAFVRNAKIPDRFFGKVDKGIMSYYLIVRNVPNPYDYIGLSGAQTFTQTVKMVWLDGAGNLISVTNTTESDATQGLTWFDDVPENARAVSMAFITDYPFYAVGQISLIAYPSALEFAQEASKLFNVFFWIGVGLVVVCPVALILEDVIRKRRISLRIVDLVHVQGPRYMRAFVYTVMMALLYFMFQWVRAMKPKDDGSFIPLLNGLSSGFFSQRPSLKTIKSVIFIASFVAVGIMFWPLFVCYAHAADGSRTASILGALVAANLVGLRFCLEYVNSQPIKGIERRIIQEIPEVVCYVAILAYFVVNAVSPHFLLTKYRKTYFKDVIHVRALLRKVPVPEKPEPEPPKTGLAALLAKLTPVDNRPIWLRGRKKISTFQEIKIFFTTFRMPVRLMAAILMMCLFTYFVLIAQLFALLDSNAKLSCQLGLYTDSLIETFATVFQLMGDFTGAQSFGSPLADTLRDLTLQIRSETEGGVVEEMFNLLLGCVVASMILAALLLVYNIIDFCLVVRADMKKLRKGDYSRVEDYGKMATSQAVQFMGTQIGYAYMGSLYLMTILLILCFIVALFIKFRFFRELFWRFVMQNGLIFISIAVGLVLSLLQKYIVEIFFVAKLRESPSEHPDAENAVVDKKGEVVISTKFWLQRAVGYNQVDFFFLFPNLITGLLSFLSNLIKMILGSALYAYRLDKKTEYSLPFLGSKSGVYFSWLLQEHHHSNAVVLIFTKLLSDWATLDRLAQPPSAGHTKTDKDLRSARIRTRWAVLYTLVNNPSLAKFRKHVVRDTYIREYIAHTEAPLLREQELQRVRAETARLEEARGELRERELAIWKKATEGGFGRDALARKVQTDVKPDVVVAPVVVAPSDSKQQAFAVPGSAYDYNAYAAQAAAAQNVYAQPASPQSVSPYAGGYAGNLAPVQTGVPQPSPEPFMQSASGSDNGSLRTPPPRGDSRRYA
ncbi:hypothetical protein HDU96_002728 [Phlyctochytrium bullatum]|nr:hypothetical protein HDU96_002728 [Phlyctochytrium bullatum]